MYVMNHKKNPKNLNLRKRIIFQIETNKKSPSVIIFVCKCVCTHTHTDTHTHTHTFKNILLYITQRESGVHSQVESNQRLKKWYLIPPCSTLSTIRYVSRVKWSNPGKGVMPSLHFCEVAIEKGTFRLPSITVANFIYISQRGASDYCLTQKRAQ